MNKEDFLWFVLHFGIPLNYTAIAIGTHETPPIT